MSLARPGAATRPRQRELPRGARRGWRWLAVALWLLQAWRASADEAPLSQWVHDTWTQDQGLPQNSVFALARTPDGYLWLSTFEGLVRFDGVRFVPQPLVTDQGREWKASPEALLVDRQGTLWIGTSLGVLRLRDGKMRALPFAAEAPMRKPLTVVRLLERRDGSVWVVNGTAPPQRVAAGELQPLAALQGARLDGATALAEGPDGALWVAAASGVWRLAGDHPAAVRVAAACSGAVERLHVTGDGTLWLMPRAGGVCTGTLEAGVAPRPTPAGPVAVHAPFDDGTALWLPTRSGVLRYQGGEFSSWSGAIGAACVLVDPEGSVWIGDMTVGLHRIRPTAVATYWPQGGPPSLEVHTLAAAPDGAIYVGATGWAVYRIHGDALAAVRPPAGDAVPSPYSWPSLAVLGDGTLASSQGNQLWLQRPGGEPERLAFDALAAASALTLLVDAQGALWIGGNAPGAIGVYQRGAFRAVASPKPFAVTAMALAPSGAVWLGGPAGLLTQRGGALVAVDLALPAGDRVSHLTLDERGVVWASSWHGLWRIDAASTFHFGRAQGLPFERLHGVLDDGRGKLWLHCNQGLYAVARTELDEVAAGRRRSVSARSFDQADGLRSREFNAGSSSSLRDARGRLWFANLKGAMVVDPARVRRNPLPPPVLIEALHVDGGAVDLAAARIGPGPRQVSVDYTATSLLVPGRVRFRYRIEGLDEDWVEAGTRRTAFYTGLPPGTHRFVVKACNNDGVWNDVGASLTLEVAPFFHQTAAFWVLLGIAATGLVGLAFRLRVRQLEARQRQLQAMVEARTHDLAEAKARGDSLLLNILPAQIALRLQEDGRAIADHHPEVSVLFADLVGFTDLSSRVSAAEIVELLGDIFTRFDGLLEQHGIEKIKTIGDAYMAVAGVPAPVADPARAAVELGLGMFAQLAEFNAAHGLNLEMRIGISTGPVVAGVIGRRKFIYDLWGDTVNTASRMESHGVPGRIHVSAETWMRISAHYAGEDRGVIPIKGKGEMRTYLVQRRGGRSAGPAEA